MLKDKTLTYISLFSSAGVGCHGFQEAGFACIATNELIGRRLDIQRYNKKCRFETGYICADIKEEATKERIFEEISRWERLGNDKVDVLIATPPCQGMSVANHKKTDREIDRNSLVVESIRLIQKISPRFFLFENVPAFMKTGCTSPQGDVRAIGDVIWEELGGRYVIASRVLNFKNYGAASSRNRTVVIGVCSQLSEDVAPVELYPDYHAESTLRQVIGKMPPLAWGEISQEDIYHAFRVYPERMRCWIHGLKEGQSAFDNEEEEKRPHRVVNGQIVPNQQKNGDKYTRQYWDRVGPCIHTRNDQLASQSTVHPEEDRVFSIRELMKMMTIPQDFRWVDRSLEELNALPLKEKQTLLKKEAIKIRQSIGEAVPTEVFYQIACKIKRVLSQERLTGAKFRKVIEERGLADAQHLAAFVRENPLSLGASSLARIAELSNSRREHTGAYYTNKLILNEICRELPDFEKEEIFLLEPSVGVGNFLPILAKKYEGVPQVHIDVVDIDEQNLELLKLLLEKEPLPANVKLNFLCADTLLHPFERHYDLVVGNPPFTKLSSKEAARYLEGNLNQDTRNTCDFFLEKALKLGDHVAMILPKALLNVPEFSATRKLLSDKRVTAIQDFGENGFKGVLVETICLFVSCHEKPAKTVVSSLTLKKRFVQKQSYIMDSAYPYWLIYRDAFFDRISGKLEFDRFTVFRDRQITKENSLPQDGPGCIRILKSRNISDDGSRILDQEGYDSYMDEEEARSLTAYRYVDDKDVYLTPNMTYYPRVMYNDAHVIVNGSVAVLIPKDGAKLTERQREYFSSEEYRDFYRIARNYQTRSLNVDATSVFFYGVLKEEKDETTDG